MTKGHLVLQGGAEFTGDMAAADRRSIEIAGGNTAKIRIIPAAAAPDNNHEKAGLNGKLWFESLGAEDVSVVPLIDFNSAQNLKNVDALKKADLIFLLGGFPVHLARSLNASKSLQAIKTAYGNGAIISGSSAGAMVLCDWFFDPYKQKMVTGIGLVRCFRILPHFNTSGHHWETRLKENKASIGLLGIDEQTAVINDGPNRRWQVYGKGNATFIKNGQKTVCPPNSFLPEMTDS